MRSTILSALSSTLAILFGITAAASPHARSLRKHHAGRAESEDTTVGMNFTSRALERRFDEARFTYYAVGLGACGKTNVASDFVVALNSAQFAGGSHCFETITISVDGKSTSAQIVDECPGCPFAGLDFSSGLFQFFAPESVGVLTGSWNFGAGAAPSPSPSPKPTTHSTPPPPSTTATPTHTTTSHSSTTHSTTPSPSSSVASTTSQSTTSSSAAAATSTATTPGNIQQLFLAHIQISTIPLALVALNGTNGSGSS